MQKRRDEIKDLRQFGMVLAGTLMVFGFIHFLKGHMPLFGYFLSFGIVTLVLALAIPKVLKGVYVIFIKVTKTIGWFNTKVILIFIYFVILIPIALVMKIFGKDPLSRQLDKDTESYWIKRSIFKPAHEQLEKQF